jgi:hypothetical protein
MTLPITVDNLRTAYDYLNTSEPFIRWNLPDGEDVEFRITRSKDNYGTHRLLDHRHFISISAIMVGHTSTLMAVMAHEMIHVHEAQSAHSEHGKHSVAFKRWAAQVCKAHGFDPRAF